LLNNALFIYVSTEDLDDAFRLAGSYGAKP
jgi:hypothetical protein